MAVSTAAPASSNELSACSCEPAEANLSQLSKVFTFFIRLMGFHNSRFFSPVSACLFEFQIVAISYD